MARGPGRVLKNPKSDPQREQLYTAENEFRPRQKWTAPLKRAQIRAVIAEVTRLYGLPPCTLAYTREGGWWLGQMETTFSDGQLTRGTMWCNTTHGGFGIQDVLHELAHLVAAKYFGDGIGHGPEFVGISMWLYNRYRVIPADAYRVILRRYKVKHRTFEESSPRALQSMAKRKAA
jgi:hypothetical protein